MFCPGCGAANRDGAKFCGACGARIEAGPATLPPAATAPTVARMAPAARVLDPSAASLAPPPPARRGRLAVILGLDLGLAVVGLVLWTRPPARAPAGPPTVAEVGGGTTPTPVAPNAGSGGSGGSAGGGGGSGPGRAGHEPGGVRPGTNLGSSVGPGPGLGTAAGGAAIDARSLDDRLTDAASAAEPAVEVDAAAAVEPAGEVDAAGGGEPATEVDAGATGEPIDADTDDEVSAGRIEAQFNHLAVSSQSKFGRCYQTATKALPDDQPLVGEVDIALAVMPTGQTDNVRVERNTTGSQTLASCALGIVRAWVFSPHDGAGPLQFSRSFRFGPGL